MADAHRQECLLVALSAASQARAHSPRASQGRTGRSALARGTGTGRRWRGAATFAARWCLYVWSETRSQMVSRRSREDAMRVHLLRSALSKAIGRGIRKAMLWGAVLGGLLATVGATKASARPAYACDRPAVRVVVRGGYFAPGPVYVAPGYFYGPRRIVVVRQPLRHRFWDARY